jgi:methionyl-tRNA formyltransferase
MNPLNNQLNIIFFGTSDFAEIILKKLLSAESCSLLAVITQPDQPFGRKKIMTPPPAKLLAEQHNLAILQPEEFNEKLEEQLKKFSPDLFIVAAYGKIIPAHTLNIAKYGALNIHPSLLPKYRGPSPIQTALLNGDKTIGTTIMLLDEKMDHGPIINQQSTIINQQDNYLSLSKKLAEQSAELLIKTIPDYLAGKIKAQKQNHQQATFTRIIKKEDGFITEDKTAITIFNMWRAYMPWPGIFGQLRANSKQLTIKLLDIELKNLIKHKNKPLELFKQEQILYLACAKQTALKINQLQPQGKKTMDAKSFINGYMK